MNWLRRLIPWAFKHQMRVDTQAVRHKPTEDFWEFRLICRRCGFQSAYYEMHNYKEFKRELRRRGCRGAR